MERIGEHPCWAADNGCYSRGDAFRLAEYLAWLERMRQISAKCLFATAPDVLGDAAATWERSRNVLPIIRSLGYKAALVGQDGLEREHIDWQVFDVLFVGGTTTWKMSEAAYWLVTEARRRGKHTHMGRVNSRRRFMAAVLAGYDSADGTFLAFGPDQRLRDVCAWFQSVSEQPHLWQSILPPPRDMDEIARETGTGENY